MLRHIKPILQVITLASAMLVSFSHILVLTNTPKNSRTFHLVHIIIPNYKCLPRRANPLLRLAHYLGVFCQIFTDPLETTCLFVLFCFTRASMQRLVKCGLMLPPSRYGTQNRKYWKITFLTHRALSIWNS